jgi:hypothetical protein
VLEVVPGREVRVLISSELAYADGSEPASGVRKNGLSRGPRATSSRWNMGGWILRPDASEREERMEEKAQEPKSKNNTKKTRFGFYHDS